VLGVYIIIIIIPARSESNRFYPRGRPERAGELAGPPGRAALRPGDTQLAHGAARDLAVAHKSNPQKKVLHGPLSCACLW